MSMLVFHAAGRLGWPYVWRAFARRAAQVYGPSAGKGLAAGSAGLGLYKARKYFSKTKPKMAQAAGSDFYKQIVRHKRSRSGAAIIRDPASYTQLAEYKRKTGRKIRQSVRQDRILKSLIEHVRFRYANFTKVNAANGAVQLHHAWEDATPTAIRYPVHLYNLTAVNQGGVADGSATAQGPAAGYFLASTAAGAFNFSSLPGLSSDGTTARSSYQVVGPSDVTTPIIGRKGFLEWTRVRLCVWGKTQNPSNVRISMVQFTDAQYCPEDKMVFTTNVGTAIDQDPTEFWGSRVRPLLNGKIAGQPRVSQRGMKVLKTWELQFNPIDAGAETAASDARGHMKHLDLFSRWNKSVDFTEKLSTENAFTYAQLTTAARTSVPSTGYTGLPGTLEKSIYLMIESVSPANVVGPGTVNAGTQVSYDINIETSWGHVQKLS